MLKSSTYARWIGGSAGATLALVMAFAVPSAAMADEGNGCATAAETLAHDRGLDASIGLEFACGPGTIQVQSARTGETIHLKKESSGFPSSIIHSEAWPTNHFDTIPPWNFGNGSYIQGVQSIHIDNIHVRDTSRAFEIDLKIPQLASWRFLCPGANSDDPQCKWPGGQEAPL